MTDEPEITLLLEKPKRPAEFTEELFDAICERMMGGEWLRKICDHDPEMPSRQTFLRWIEKDSGRQEKYARASRAMVDYWAEELLEISHETEKDTIIEPNGRRKCNHEWVANKRLHSDNLKFLMSKIYPKRYGDKLPETEGAKDADADRLTVKWQEPTRIERIIIHPVDPILDDLEQMIDPDDNAALRNRIKALESRLALGGLTAAPPAQIEYKPEPLPHDLSPEDWSLLTELLNMIRRTIPTDDNSPPESIFRVMRQALLMHFREVDIEASREAAE